MRRADVPSDLLAERHASNEAWRAGRIRGRGLPRPERRVCAKARGRCPNTGESSTGDQTIPRSVGGIVAVHLANIFNAAIVARQLRNGVDQLSAILGD